MPLDSTDRLTLTLILFALGGIGYLLGLNVLSIFEILGWGWWSLVPAFGAFGTVLLIILYLVQKTVKSWEWGRMSKTELIGMGLIFTVAIALFGGMVWDSTQARERRDRNQVLLAQYLVEYGVRWVKDVELTDVHVIEKTISMREGDRFWEQEIDNFLESHEGQVFFWGSSDVYTWHVAVLENGIGYELEINL